MNNQGIIFLNKIYAYLINSDAVKHTVDVAKKHNIKISNKNDAISKYLDKINRISSDSINHDDMRHIKNMYYKKYVIKDIPESYFELQKKIALERGQGHLEYTDIVKQQEKERIVQEQKESLDNWIEYFASSDANHYDVWFKYFVFQGIIRIGYYDKEKESFTKRTKDTVKPFIEVNHEAIAMMYDVMVKALNKDDINDDILLKLINNGNFSKMYAYCIKKLEEVTKDNTNSTIGIWKKYDRGSAPNILFNDIHGKGTGWCTAGGIETASNHLNGGDFYVYYTMDKEGEFTCPRIAIRMERYNIAEVRGIGPNQNLESNMETIAKEKLKEFPDGEKFQKKVNDMELLTLIHKKNQEGQNLTREELMFLYEINYTPEGFGYSKDPRIDEIKSSRDMHRDCKCIFDGTITEFDGFLNLRDLKSAEGLILPKEMNGSLSLTSLTSARGLVLPPVINGDLYLNDLTSVEGLVLPQIINGSLHLKSLTSAEGLVFPQVINGSLYLYSLTSAKGLELPKELNGGVSLNSLTNAEGLVLPLKFNGVLYLDGLTSAEGLALPQEMTGDLYLNGLTSAKGLVLPQEFNGNLYFYSLTSAEGLVLPQKFNGILFLDGLTSAKGLVLPQVMNGDLSLERLTSAEGLVLPQVMNGRLYLDGLTSAEGLVLPKEINGILSLRGLKSIDRLCVPEAIVDRLILPASLELTEENIIREKNIK